MSFDAYSKNGGVLFAVFPCEADARAHLRALQMEAAEWGGRPTIYRRTVSFGAEKITLWFTAVR